jgi:hypothetical protein
VIEVRNRSSPAGAVSSRGNPDSLVRELLTFVIKLPSYFLIATISILNGYRTAAGLVAADFVSSW